MQFEIDVNGPVSVDLFPREGNQRKFNIPSIPLHGVVIRSSRSDCPTLRIQTNPRKDIPEQDLYTPEEFDEALSDDNMLSSAHFALGCLKRAQSEQAL